MSERGGAGVLTQAMRILKDRGVSFAKTGHRAFFSNIQTNLGAAEGLVRDLQIEFDGKSHSKDWYNINHKVGSGLFEEFVNPIRRKRKDDKYSTLNCIADIGKEAANYSAGVATVVGAPGAVKTLVVTAAASGISLASATGPAGRMFAAAAAVGAAYKAANPIYKGANAVIKSYFPLAAQKKITGK